MSDASNALSRREPTRTDDTSVVRRRYDRIAPIYDALDLSMELLAFRRWRARLWERVGTEPGRVLEVGVGTGKNIPHWPAEAEITAIDLSPRMLTRARRRSTERGTEARLEAMDVEQLSLDEGSFDVAVATFVFCSVAHPEAGLHEIRRVLRPRGRLLLLEHQRSDSPVVAPLFRLLDPLVVRLWGAHVDRPTEATVRAAGFDVRSTFLTPRGLVRLIEARPR